jgi:protein ImuB
MAPKPVRLAPLAVRAGDPPAFLAVAPDGPPVRFRLGDEVHDVAAAYGPERIETAWWRGATVRRDYYVVETRAGARFWLFRRLRDGGWFLHGIFA